jgi:hypothetical protein
MRPHSVTTQKNNINIFTDMRTSNLTQQEVVSFAYFLWTQEQLVLLSHITTGLELQKYSLLLTCNFEACSAADDGTNIVECGYTLVVTFDTLLLWKHCGDV